MVKNDRDAWKLKGCHILLVEDDYSSNVLIEKVLVYHGATVVALENGEQAIRYVNAGKKPDVIILDLRLPHMDGYAVFNKIKEILPEIPVIAQTAYVYSNEPENVLALGFEAYFSKPIDFDKLVDTITTIYGNVVAKKSGFQNN